MSPAATDRDLGRLVLAVDELLRAPDAGDLLRVIRDGVPPALLDQLDAAAAETRRGLQARAARLGHTAGAVPYAAHPAWATLGLLASVATWVAGRGRTCTHAPHPDRPRPVVSSAWRSALVTCVRCTHLHGLPNGSAADRTCDGCGTVTAGPEHDGGIVPALLSVGAFTYLLGVCAGCRWWPPSPARKVPGQPGRGDVRGRNHP